MKKLYPRQTITAFLLLLSYYVAHAQNVGIGTLTPAEKLHVIGNIRSDNANKGVILDAENAPLITRGWDAFTSGSYTGLGRWGLFMEPSNLTLGVPAISNANIQFATYNPNSSVQTTLMSLLQNGNIKTIAPHALLHVFKDVDVWHSFIGGATGQLQIGGQTANGAVIQSWNPTTGFPRDLYLQRDGGRVGIGTTSPQELLDVIGGIRISGSLMPLNNAGATGQVLASNGAYIAPTWVNPTNSLYTSAIHVEQSVASVGPVTNGTTNIAGLSTSLNLSGNTKVFVNFSVEVFAPGCSFCGNSAGNINLVLDGNIVQTFSWTVNNGYTNSVNGSRMLALAAGTHTIGLQLYNAGGLNVLATSNSTATNYLECLLIAQ